MAYYCRLSFNSNGWFTPSGFQGKSTNRDNHECEFGFGFEEWLFNSRKFIDTKSEKCHFGYIDSLKDYNENTNIKKDLVLYTIRHVKKGTERFIVARLKKEEWDYINKQDYLNIAGANEPLIAEMKRELIATMPMLRSRIISSRFDQQVNCQDWNGLNSNSHRLFNIQILKTPFCPKMERVTDQTPFPDRHVLKLQRFKLFNSEQFNLL
ncbi:MAG: hypothetical protein JNJ58_03500 [Chitinophagaceae bacterium]|nr:hypothetical protein [Chitinophagaceae bacterium]